MGPGQANMVPPNPPMTLALLHVDEQIGTMGSLVDSLESRLSTLCAQSGPSKAVVANATPRMQCGQIANGLSDMGDRLMTLNNRIRLILDTLDV